MISAALSKNPLRSRADLQSAALELWRPLRPFFERDGAAARLAENEASYGAPASMVETFARPLWGVASLVAGGGVFPDAELVAKVLAEGVDPNHPRYWGKIGDRDQRAVEMGSLAAALWLAPQLLWEPLSATSRGHLASWLQQINTRTLWDNNWLFFRVLVNGALRSLGQPADEKKVASDLLRLKAFAGRGGWATDGTTPQFDYYIPMALHFYALFFDRMTGGADQSGKALAQEAARFAPDFAAWFARDGSALPIGRSLSYRFAQGAFWGGLAFAGVEALPWGAVKRLHLQHLRWWLQQPIFTETGLLTVGYRYPNQIMAEAYNAPGSPYWAMKAFLPLALPETHPFWTAEEQEQNIASVVAPDGCERLVVCRDERRDHVFALTSNEPHPAAHRYTVQKYTKFAYSTAFGFHTPVGGTAPRHGAGDSTLLLSVDGQDWRTRGTCVDASRRGEQLHMRWEPWPDVTVDSWLAPALPGHVRVHRIRTPRPLQIFEGGFPIEITANMPVRWADAGRAAVNNGRAHSAIFELAGERKPELITPEPNTNLLHPRAIVPALTGAVFAGDTWLFTAVAGLPGGGQGEAAKRWRDQLRVEISGAPKVWHGASEVIVTQPSPAGERSSVRLLAAPAERPGLWSRLKRRAGKWLRRR